MGEVSSAQTKVKDIQQSIFDGFKLFTAIKPRILKDFGHF